MVIKGVYKRPGSDYYYICINYRNTRYRFTTKTTSPRIAEKIYAVKKAALIAGEYSDVIDKKMTLQNLVDLYLQYSKTNKRLWKRDEGLTDNLLAFFGSDEKISQIKPFEIEKYKAMRKEHLKRKKDPNSRLSPATINKELMCLKTMFNKAILWGKVRDNPCRQVKPFRENNQIVRFLAHDEIKTLLAVCRPYMRDIVLFALNTGMRRGEILKLEWPDVDMERNVINVRDTKNGENRKMPINPTVQELLKSLKKDGGRVFKSPGGNDINDVKKGFHAALKKAKIFKFRFHDLRHTFASHLVMAGIDIMTVKELLGHKRLEMTMRYAHLSPNHKSAAVDTLASYYEKSSPKSATLLLKEECT